MDAPSIDINDRIKVIRPPMGNPGLLGAKLRVVGIGDGYVNVMVSTVTVRLDRDDVEFAELGLRKRITRNYPEVFYHGTDLVFATMPEDFRKRYLSYCNFFRETLFSKFYPYHPIGETDNKRIKALLGKAADDDPKILDNLLEALVDITSSRVTEEYEYGDFYITSDRLNAVMYAQKAFAGGEFAYSAYALVKAAKVAGLQEWYQNEQLPNLDKIVDCLIGIAEAEPHPVIYKLTDIDAEYLRTECNCSIESYIRNGWLYETEFRYNKPVDLSQYEYEVVDKDLKKEMEKCRSLKKHDTD